MNARLPEADSIWFSSLIALLVGLGAQMLLGTITPADLSDLPFVRPTPHVHRIDRESLWVGDVVIRFLSFVLGGFVGVVLRGVLSRRLALVLFVAALAGGFVADFFSDSAVAWALWLLAGPAGILLGACWAELRRGTT